MPNVISCPSEHDLQQLLLGQIPDAEAEPLEEHLEQCERCLQTAGTLKAEDTLAEAVRTQTAVPEMTTGEIVEGLMQRLEKLRPAMAPAPEKSAVTYDFLAAPQGPEEIGRLGHYRILRVLGAGGMGVVFEAEDPHLGRLVALKTMLPSLASNPSARQRFLREARAVAALEHDYIVTIHQVGEERGVPFLAMPLLKGECLEERLKREPRLPVPLVIQIGREIAEGLAAAHARGLVHRDIKPANLWLEAKEGGSMKEVSASPFKRVKILDFGLARAANDATSLTQSGAIVGSPAYMAPEQTRAGGVVDQRVDLFSLGCVLYRAATGELPFKGTDTMSILAALALDTPRAPRELNPRIPAALSDLIMELLAKKPADRPASAQAVVARIQVLEEASRERKLASRERKRPEDRYSGRLRSRLARPWLPVAVALVVGALALAAFQFGPAVYRFTTDQGQVIIETKVPDVQVIVRQDGKEITILDEKTKREVTLQSGKYQVAPWGSTKDGLSLSTGEFTLERGGQVIVEVKSVPAVRKTTASAPRKTTVPVDSRVIHVFHSSAKPLTQDGVTSEEGAWRIDAQRPRTVRLFEIPNPGVEECMVLYRASMKTVDLKGRAYLEMLCRFPIGEAFSKGLDHPVEGTTDWSSYQTPFFLKRGERPDLIKLSVVIEGKGTVWIKNVELLQEPLPGTKEVLRPATSSERRGAAPGEVRIFKGHTEEVTGVKFSPDGSRAFSSSKDGKVRCWDIQDGLGIWKADPGEARALDVSPDGRCVLAGTRGGAILYDAGSGNLLHYLSTEKTWCMSVAFSGDSHRALIAGLRSTFALWDVEVFAELVQFESPGWTVSSVALSPDCRWAVTGSDHEPNVRLWNLRTGDLVKSYEGHRVGILGLAFSPNSCSLLSAGSDGTVRCWDVSTGKMVWMHQNSKAVNCVAFSPDGRRALYGGTDHTVRLLDAATGRELYALSGSAGPVRSVAFSPDGRFALSGGVDQCLRLWQLPAPEPTAQKP